MNKPPPRTKRRFLRVSLRTLLVLLTVGCVWLGWKVNKAQKQRAAVAWIEEMGGSVKYSGVSPNGPTGVQELVGIDSSFWVARIDCYESTELTEMSSLANLDELRWVTIVNCPVSDLTPLRKLTKLENLYIDGTAVRDLTPLKDLTNLEYLRLCETQVADLTPLARLGNLKALDLTGTLVTCPTTEVSAEESGGATPLSEILPDKPWPERRKEVERRWLELLGAFPTEIPELRPEMKEVAKEDGITRYHVSFQSEESDRVTAWLLVPNAAREKPTPAIICIHQTTFGSGKDSLVGLSGRRPIDPPRDPQLGAAYGLELARHGFVTFNMDLLTDGERIHPGDRVMDTRRFYLEHPEWSIIGKTVWDVMRSVDFLQTLDFVDHQHIGCTGWSMGGHLSLFAAAFEPRITAMISNGGVLDWYRKNSPWARNPSSWQPWKEGDPKSNNTEFQRRFGFTPNSGPFIFMKNLRPYLDDPSKRIPVDFDSLMAMVAPRPLMIISSEQEFYRHKIFPKCLETFPIYVNWRDAEGLPSAMKARQERIGYAATLEYYETQHKMKPERMPEMLSQLGAGDCFGWFSFPGGHSYPGVARRHTFAWYDRWLGRTLE